MGFTPAAIVAPNVPDKVDPIKYLTTPVQSRAQEQAQVQAQTLAYAKLHGMSASELERIIFGAEARKPVMNKPLSREEQQELQDNKTCTIPTQITPPPDVPNTSVDYPYLFTNVRTRHPYQVMEVCQSSNPDPPREASMLGKTQAPVVSLSENDLEIGSQFIETISDKLAEYGIVKLAFPETRTPARLPIGPDVTGFRTIKQAVFNNDTNFDFRQIKRGFFRALIRFHTTTEGKRRMQRLPTLERKPIDFYRLYHLVDLHGGADSVTRRKAWAQVGREMGYSSYAVPTLSSAMRQTYARVLQPLKDWLSSELPTPLNPHLIPRLDVDDVGDSKWHRLAHGIVIDTEARNTSFTTRKVRDFEDIKNSPPCYTIKLFKHGKDDQSSSISVSELENQFASLPEWYETERMYPRAKLMKYPNEYRHYTSVDPALLKNWDPWDISAISLRDNRDFFPFIADQDLDDILLAELDVGAKFSTQDWYTPLSGTYEVNLAVDGHPRTWYTKSGVWTDQKASEIVIVDPNAEVLNWCHGFSFMATARILLNSNWLVNVCQRDLTDLKNDPVVCVQQTLFRIAQACSQQQPILPNVKSQALAVLNRLCDHELSLLQELHKIPGIYENRQIVEEDSGPAVCQRTKKRRFFSWIVSNGQQPLCVEEFLESRKSEPNTNAQGIQLVTKYNDPQEFFNKMKSAVSACPVIDPNEWPERTSRCLIPRNGEQKLPTEEDLKALVTNVPEKFSKLAVNLSRAISKLHHWLRSKNQQFEYRDAVDCADNGTQVADIYKVVNEETSKAVEQWKTFYDTIMNVHQSQNAPADVVDNQHLNPETVLGEANKLLHDHGRNLNPQHRKSLMDVARLITWTREVCDALKKYESAPSPQLNSRLISLVAEGIDELEINNDCSPLVELTSAPKKHHLSDEMERNLSFLLGTGNALIPARIVEMYEKYFSSNGLPGNIDNIDQTLVAEFSKLYQNMPLIRRMEEPNLLDRPRRSEVVALNSIGAINHILAQLDAWLETAKQLDWVTIASRLRNMAANQPPAPIMGAFPIAIASIVNVYTQLFYLKVMPDDVESVRTAFENTIERLTRTPLATVIQYGFVP